MYHPLKINSPYPVLYPYYLPSWYAKQLSSFTIGDLPIYCPLYYSISCYFLLAQSCHLHRHFYLLTDNSCLYQKLSQYTYGVTFSLCNNRFSMITLKDLQESFNLVRPVNMKSNDENFNWTKNYQSFYETRLRWCRIVFVSHSKYTRWKWINLLICFIL